MKLFCKHREVRCIHGDEILTTMRLSGRIARVCCVDCGKRLYNEDLPIRCWFTGRLHSV